MGGWMNGWVDEWVDKGGCVDIHACMGILCARCACVQVYKCVCVHEYVCMRVKRDFNMPYLDLFVSQAVSHPSSP